jgi:hypothetical protein
MSWPQDLYKVGEYDSDEGELWDDGSSEASWETESEDCFIADDVYVLLIDLLLMMCSLLKKLNVCKNCVFTGEVCDTTKSRMHSKLVSCPF